MLVWCSRRYSEICSSTCAEIYVSTHAHANAMMKAHKGPASALFNNSPGLSCSGLSPNVLGIYEICSKKEAVHTTALAGLIGKIK